MWFQDAAQLPQEPASGAGARGRSGEPIQLPTKKERDCATSRYFDNLLKCYVLMCYGEQDLQQASQVTFEAFFGEAVKYLTLVAGCVVRNIDVLRQLIESCL